MLPLVNGMSLGKSHQFSEPQFPYMIRNHGLVVRLNEISCESMQYTVSIPRRLAVLMLHPSRGSRENA